MWTIKKNKERIQKLRKTRDSQYIYQHELDKACFQHDIAYGDFKDLTRKEASDEILHDKEFNIAKNPKYYRSQRGLCSMVYRFLIKRLGVVPLSLQTNPLSKMKIFQSKNYGKNYTSQLLGNLKKEKYTHLL